MSSSARLIVAAGRSPAPIDTRGLSLRTSTSSSISCAQHLAEALPLRPREAIQLPLLDEGEIGRRTVERHARQEQRQLQVLDVGGLLHHVLARQVVAALLQYLDHRLR